MVHGNERLKRASAVKQQVYYAVESPLKGNGIAKAFGFLVLVLIIANALLVFGESQSDLPDVVYAVFAILGLASTICFGIEYCARLWVADILYPEKTPAKARFRYMVSLMGIIDLLAFAPAMVTWFIPLSAQVLSSIRIIRLVRLIKLSRYMAGVQSITRVISSRKQEIVAAFMVLALLTVTASVLMYQVENPVQPDKFDSVFTGMYWAMTTITSTGYGDLVPLTAAGRIIGFCTMVLSIAVVAIPAGIFSAGFVAQFQSDDRRMKRERFQEEREHEGRGSKTDQDSR